jgi:glycosyltransferase involved in cell wall biosynthesis|tara:strand:- start:10402 stop:11598 length:1197 start_codon:yes stop_codon:yes gene_type:complete
VNNQLIQQKITDLNVCVLMPTYNNERTLKRVIDGVLQFTQHLIVVNDGSTDSTTKILEDYSTLQQIHFKENKGKGQALRQGFKHAESLGYKYVITIDSDGQHFPKDIPVFIDELEQAENKNLLLIGARNMAQESVPKKSSFGNKFSNFWFWAETGIKLQDTQSGFRLYPIHHFKNLNFYTNKFEFEIEVIVKAAWNGSEVKNIPILVLYDETERVSHFRPFKDFTRISILNTWLVILTLFYIKPRNLFRRLKKKGIKRFLVEDVIGSNDSPQKKALSIALGIFIGITPLWGFHTIIVLSLALILNLNKAIAFAFSNVSLPPFIPFIVLGSFILGNTILGQNETYNLSTITTNFEVLKHLKAYIIGSFALAAVSALIAGIFSYFILLIFQKKKVSVPNA